MLFLGVWEQLSNPGFNSLEFEGIENEAGRHSLFLSARNWIEATGAIGVHAKAGRDGGFDSSRPGASRAGAQFNAIAITEMRSLLGISEIKQLSSPKAGKVRA